ncbi:hypothetical protein GCM10023189_52800 [Nibrella saemangeumensis]|uniref:Uncharacterized protein n=1 Tax=Nibrella saemangeumensis TaxID=1084526 RepID=A0ABP8NMN1_9BACT
MENPFKQLEPDASCPAHLKTELVSEIDLIRNALQVVVLYTGSLFDVAAAMADTGQSKSETNP